MIWSPSVVLLPNSAIETLIAEHSIAPLRFHIGARLPTMNVATICTGAVVSDGDNCLKTKKIVAENAEKQIAVDGRARRLNVRARDVSPE